MSLDTWRPSKLQFFNKENSIVSHWKGKCHPGSSVSVSWGRAGGRLISVELVKFMRAHPGPSLPMTFSCCDQLDSNRLPLSRYSVSTLTRPSFHEYKVCIVHNVMQCIENIHIHQLDVFTEWPQVFRQARQFIYKETSATTCNTLVLTYRYWMK